MTRNSLIKGVLVGFLSVPWGFADGQPEESRAASSGTAGSVEASKQSRIRFGGISLTSGYRYGGPVYWGRPPFYGYYNSQFWRPFWQPHFPYGSSGFSGFYPGDNFQRGPSMGEIKLQVEPVMASVFINDAHAGEVQDLKSFSLEPGVYNLRIEIDGRPGFAQRVYVLSGKTLKIEADLMAAKANPQP
ncbi:MAG TPA: hypothetical protein VHP35_05835 [Terriglobia bacterium]|nr:hypothetical protein [Terriglobia bacterium]